METLCGILKLIPQENGSQEQHSGNRILGNASDTNPPIGGSGNRGGNQPPNSTVPPIGGNEILSIGAN